MAGVLADPYDMGEAVESLLRRIGVEGDPPDSAMDAQGRLYIKLTGGVGPCSIGHGGHNWVSENGGLPNYICHVAKALIESGHPESSAIAIAVGQIKKWAAGVHGGVGRDGVQKPGKAHAGTQAKAAAALAEWNALKAKAHAKGVGKHVTKGLENGLNHDEAQKAA